jgi:hypothetical protein
MELPKLVYDDFYKFLMSLGVVLFIISLTIGIFIADEFIKDYKGIFITICLLSFITGIITTICAGKAWFKNQKILDRKLEAETKLIEGSAQQQEVGSKKETNDKQTVSLNDRSALVNYKIASVLPGTKSFSFLKDWKVWFLIENYERNKYKAYITVEFISDNKKETENKGYYGGKDAWNLNALSRIVAPGLDIPDWVKENARQRKKIEIKIYCEVKDENNNLIEKKLPSGYIYDYSNDNWYYQP